MRRWMRILGVTLLAGVALAVFAVYAVVSGRFPSLTREAVERVAAYVLETEVRVGRVSGSLLADFVLYDVGLGPQERPSIRFGELHVALSPTSFDERRAVLESLRIVGIEIRIARDAAGEWTVAGMSLSPTDEATVPDAPVPVSTVEVARLEIEDARLHAEWGEGAEQVVVRGRADLEARDVRWPPPESLAWPEAIEARLDLESARLAGRDFARGSVAARLRDGALSLEASGVEVAGGRIDLRAEAAVRGSLSEPELGPSTGTLRFTGLDLARVWPDAVPTTSLDGSLAFDWEEDRLRGRVALDPSRVADVAIDAALLRGSLAVSEVRPAFDLEQVELEAAFGRISARVAGDAERARRLKVDHAEIDLALLPEAWRPDGFVRGRVAGRAALSGPWRDPTGDFDLEVDDVVHDALGGLTVRALGRALGRRRFRLDALEVDATESPVPAFVSLQSFELRLVPGGASVRGARVRGLGSEVQIEGGYAQGRFDDLWLRSDGVSLAALVEQWGDPDEELGLAGTLDADLRLDGTLEAPLATGRIGWSEPRLLDVGAQRLEIDLAPEGPARMTARARLVGEDDLLLRADVDLPVAGLLTRPASLLDREDVRAEIDLEEIDAAWLTPWLPAETPAVRGRISGQAKLRGPARAPFVDATLWWADAEWGTLTADRVDLHTVSASPEQPLRAELQIRQADVEVLGVDLVVHDRERLASPRALLFDPGTRLALRLDGFDLAWLRPGVPQETVFVDGRLRGSVRVEGGPIPSALGQVEIEDLTLSGSPLPTEIGPTAARLEFAEQSMRLVGLRFVSGEGELWLRGNLSWLDPSDPEARLDVRLTRFALQQPGVVEGVLDGDFELVGRPNALVGKGGLLLHHARLDLPDREDPVVREIRVHRLASSDEQTMFEDALLANAEGELVLRLGESVQLRGIGAELEVEGELIARKRPGEPPGLYGSVNVVSGRFDFRGKWLRVVRGSAIFDGSPDPDPFVDATAVHRVRDVEIRVRLVGRASALMIEIDSDPPLSREEQLAYLLFDRPVLELAADDQANIGTAAGLMAGDLLLGQIGNEIAREVGLDRVRLGVDDAAAPTFEIEKQLHERVTARYGRSFGVDGGDRFVLEWRVFRRLFLSGEQSTNGTSALDVYWRLEY